MNAISYRTSVVSVCLMFMLITVLNACGQSNSNNNTDKMKTEDNLPIQKTEDEWKKTLSPDQYYILRQKGTEPAFSGKLLMNKDKGIYTCAGCGNELFTDGMKFDSHCGWPSFDKEIAGGKIIKKEDNTHGMRRTEIMCGRCGGHLGHIFDDGPTETGMRYCVNSVSIDFVSEKDIQNKQNVSGNTIDTITLGGGCYWCVEAVYQMLDGVLTVESGFSGGMEKDPSYREVCGGRTGHAEVVQITFDNTKTSLDEIFKVFFTVHDPTTLNRQGADVGTQYRSAIFYRNAAQETAAKSIIETLNKGKVYSNPIVTEVAPFNAFYKADADHQNYYNDNKEQPYCRMVIQPKIEKFEKVFKNRMKK
jgi:peptide methionine sulfoxide reductase msrA/msrB